MIYRLPSILFLHALLSLLPRGRSDLVETRSALVDASVYLLYLPSLMSVGSVTNLSTALQLFLESNTDYDSIKINEIKVMFSSQRLNGRKAVDDNSTFYVVQTNVQFLVSYQTNYNDDLTNQSTIENVIRSRFHDDWTELRATLRLLDPNFFDYLKYIELKSKTLDFSRPIFDDDDNASELKTGIPDRALIIYLTLGIAILVASFTLLLPVCLTRRQCKHGSARETTISSFESEGSRGQVGETSSKPRLHSTEMKSVPPPSRQHVRWTPSEICVNDDGGSTSHIQRKFSEDKLYSTQVRKQHSESNRDLRVQKRSAENNLLANLQDIRLSISDEDIELGKVETDDSDYIQRMNPALAARHCLIGKERPTVPLKKKNRAPASERPPLLNDSLPVREVAPSGSTPFPVIYHTNDHDGCSVSTITGGGGSLFGQDVGGQGDELVPACQAVSIDKGLSERTTVVDEEDDDNDDDTSCNTSLTYHIGSEADDFGSIAQSLPSCPGGSAEHRCNVQEV